MLMPKTLLSTAAVAALLASCTPPPVPPPRFTPNPPYPPRPVDPYAQTTDPYTQESAEAPQVAPDPAPAPPARQGEFPTARPTAKPGEVISPYEPYNVIDVSEYSSGSLVRDPENKKIFRVP